MWFCCFSQRVSLWFGLVLSFLARARRWHCQPLSWRTQQRFTAALTILQVLFLQLKQPPFLPIALSRQIYRDFSLITRYFQILKAANLYHLNLPCILIDYQSCNYSAIFSKYCKNVQLHQHHQCKDKCQQRLVLFSEKTFR